MTSKLHALHIIEVMNEYLCGSRDESVSEKETRLAEINTKLSELEHKLKLMQILQTTEGHVPTRTTKNAKLSTPKDRPSIEEDNAASIAQTSEDQAEVLEGSKDDAQSVSATSVAATVDHEEEPPAISADESHVELEEDEEADETKEEVLDDEVDESQDQEIEEAEELGPGKEEEESTEVVHEEQVSSEGVSKPKNEQTNAQATKLSLQQGAASEQVISLIIYIKHRALLIIS